MKWESPTSKQVILVSAADENYAMPLAVMLKSAELNLRHGWRIDAYVLNGGLSLDSKWRLRASLDRRRIRLRFIKPQTEKLEHLPLCAHLPLATYYRLLLPELLPQRMTKAIYLDADIVVLGDLATLWEQEIAESPLLAVQDGLLTVGSQGVLRQYRELGIPADSPYMNCGVLVMNLELWRREGLADRIIAYVRANAQHVVLCDQDGINAVLAERWGMLERRWNYRVNLCEPYENEAKRDRAVMERIRADAAIVHFAASVKPWYAWVKHPTRTLFFEYLSRTRWQKWTHATPDVRKLPTRQELKNLVIRLPLVRSLWSIYRRKAQTAAT